MAELSERAQRLMQPHLRSIEPYDPNFTPTRINLSANENTHPLSPRVQAAVDEALAATPLNRYPDPMSGELRNLIAAYAGVAREQVCVGNGGDELLYNFLLAFGGRGHQVLICPPCFTEYAFFAQLTETGVRAAGRDPRTLELDEESLIACARTSDLVIVTSPNNPTGDLADPGLIQRVCRACRGLVMVDEAYIEFAGKDASAAPLLAHLDNLVILRTLSKAFGAAGARCGYVLAAPDVIEAFSAIRQIYSVNVLTQAAACALLRARRAGPRRERHRRRTRAPAASPRRAAECRRVAQPRELPARTPAERQHGAHPPARRALHPRARSQRHDGARRLPAHLGGHA